MKPILFNSDIVRAILDGRKTVTRRKPFQMEVYSCLKGLFRDDKNRLCAQFHKPDNYYAVKSVVAPYCPGDILYVREAWAEMPYGYVYRSDDGEPEGWDVDDRWRPSIYMPREAARLFLRVTDVRAERLRDISLDDVYREGFMREDFDEREDYYALEKLMASFARLWDGTIKPADRDRYGWEANPFCWVISFERISKEEAEHGLQSTC